jgi:hypothetical protein
MVIAEDDLNGVALDGLGEVGEGGDGDVAGEGGIDACG